MKQKDRNSLKDENITKKESNLKEIVIHKFEMIKINRYFKSIEKNKVRMEIKDCIIENQGGI